MREKRKTNKRKRTLRICKATNRTKTRKNLLCVASIARVTEFAKFKNKKSARKIKLRAFARVLSKYVEFFVVLKNKAKTKQNNTIIKSFANTKDNWTVLFFFCLS